MNGLLRSISKSLKELCVSWQIKESSIKAEHLQMKEKETKIAQKLLDVQTKAYEKNGRNNSLERPAQ